MIKCEKRLFGERRNKLNGEKRIASGLLVDQLRQGSGSVQFAVKGIGDQLSQIVMAEGRKHDVLHYRSSFADRFELAHQWMGGIDFVVAIGSDQQQMPHIHLSQQALEQIECRRVEPLQIVQEQGERMFRPCEYADESPEHQLEAALRVLHWKFRDGWLFSQDKLQFGNQVHDEASVRT